MSKKRHLLTAATVKSLVSSNKTGRYADGGNLFLVIRKSGYASWVFRYINPLEKNKRPEPTLGSFESLSLSDARKLAHEWRVMIERGQDPLTQRQIKKAQELKTVNSLWESFAELRKKQIETQYIEQSLYRRKILPTLGNRAITDVRPLDINELISNIKGRNSQPTPSTANKTLSLLKNLFKHGVKLGVIDNNPAEAFDRNDAGGKEEPRQRVLSEEEVRTLFTAMRDAGASFSRENYLAVFLLLVLGVRKMELLSEKWEALDLKTGTWLLKEHSVKTREAITLPVEPELIEMFQELKIYSAGSKYIFPARKKSNAKNPKHHVGNDTLNSALNKLDHGLEHFRVHDFRRTCRTWLSSLTILPHIAERYINHKQNVYDVYDYLDERRAAQRLLIDKVWPLTGLDKDTHLSHVWKNQTPKAD